MSHELFICRKFLPITRHDKCNCALVSLLPFFEYNDPNTMSELVSIVARGDIPALQRHLDGNKKMRVCDKHGNGPLHLAVIFKKVEVFEYLLTVENMNVSALNRYGQTCMHLAVINDSEYFVRQLIKRGGDVNLPDESCCTPLHAAATRYCPKICEILLEHGANLNFQNLLGKTALYHACQYGTLDSVYMLLYHGASASIPDVYGVLPLTAAMQQSMNSEDPIPQSHQECHEVLFNYTFEQKAVSTNLSILTVAMKADSSLFPQIMKKIDHVKFSRHDLRDLCYCALSIRPQYFKMFIRKFGYVVREMILSPSDLHYKLTLGENVDVPAVKFMEFLTLVFEMRPSYNFVKGSMNFTYFISFLINLYKEKRLSLEILKQMIYFLYSQGLPCELIHLIVVYETFGFCDLVKFLLDLDIVVTYERPKAVIPYLLYDINMTMDKFIKCVKRPSKEYRAALKFFATPNVRNFFGKSKFFKKTLRKAPQLPSLLELSREASRRHIVDVFKIEKTRDFYRIVSQLPVNEVYKKILTYERELYQL